MQKLPLSSRYRTQAVFPAPLCPVTIRYLTLSLPPGSVFPVPAGFPSSPPRFSELPGPVPDSLSPSHKSSNFFHFFPPRKQVSVFFHYLCFRTQILIPVQTILRTLLAGLAAIILLPSCQKVDYNSLPIEVPTLVNMGLSVQWTDINVGAVQPYDIGYYYAWGEFLPKGSYSSGNYLETNYLH